MSAGATNRLLAFAMLAVLAAAQWASLLADPAAGRFAVAVLVATAAAGVLLALDAAGVEGWRARAATAAVFIVGGVGGLVAIGLPAAELMPWRWGELGASIDLGIADLRGQFDYPLESENELAGALLVAAMPILLAGAATLGFRPGREPGPGLGALVLLIACFAIPATARPTAAPLLWGAAILMPIGLWLWAPRMRTPVAYVLLAAAGALAVPVASSVASDEPLIDYRGWTLEEPDAPVNFGWDHSYGPIDWPREGTPLFRVRSEEPRYWRAQVLDQFYGDAWRRSADGGSSIPDPVPVEALERDRWIDEARFSIQSLESPLLISPGTALGVDGVTGAQPEADGTIRSDIEPLARGVQYDVSAYVPEPSRSRMRLASVAYPEQVVDYTTVTIPQPLPGSSGELMTTAPIEVPPWGSGDDAADGVITASPYARVAELAGRLTSDAASAYDAAKAVELHLRRRYEYSENPPLRETPLPSFLFRDRVGYCQQFSGAMALMLRMEGIPARVAVGFSPGTRAAGDGEFEVTDLDAHSWVEVYFNRIGWVAFDPTPAAAPAQSQLGDIGVPAIGLDGQGGGDAGGRDPGGAGAAGAAAGDADAGGSWVGPGLLLAIALPALLLVALATIRAARHRRRSAALAGELLLRELRPALRAAGFGDAASLTLLGLEGRLRARRRVDAADYVRALRELRYRGRGGAPGLRPRRAARRQLGRGVGILARLRLLVAMPPGGPRPIPAPGPRNRLGLSRPPRPADAHR